MEVTQRSGRGTSAGNDRVLGKKTGHLGVMMGRMESQGLESSNGNGILRPCECVGEKGPWELLFYVGH